ncbi:unnamed protein product, partial [Nesidiocoris tenuis]
MTTQTGSSRLQTPRTRAMLTSSRAPNIRTSRSKSALKKGCLSQRLLQLPFLRSPSSAIASSSATRFLKPRGRHHSQSSW